MLAQEDRCMLRQLHRQGVYQGEIAERLGAHRKTIHRAFKRGGLLSGSGRHEWYAGVRPYVAAVECLLRDGGQT